jgi:hypothetical protein
MAVGAAIRSADARIHRADVDRRPAAAALESRQRRAGAVDGAEDVRLEHLAPKVVRCDVEATEQRDAGVIDPEIDTPEFGPAR